MATIGGGWDTGNTTIKWPSHVWFGVVPPQPQNCCHCHCHGYTPPGYQPPFWNITSVDMKMLDPHQTVTYDSCCE